MTACQKHINSSHESPGHPSINQGRRSRNTGNTVVRGKLKLKLKSEELVWTLCVWMAILGTQRGQQRQETLPRQLNNVNLYILCLIKCKIKHSSKVSKWQYCLNDVNLHHISANPFKFLKANIRWAAVRKMSKSNFQTLDTNTRSCVNNDLFNDFFGSKTVLQKNQS